MIVLGIVVPCYNEEAVIAETVKRLDQVLGDLVRKGKIADTSAIWFVDDGSKDNTWTMLGDFARDNGRIRAVKLSRNRGHQNALLAGLLAASGDALVSIDADLQDDVSVIENMVDEYSSGAEIVYGVRRKRDTDSFFKRVTAQGFYKFMQAMGAQSIYNHADFRLMGRHAIETLREYKEVNLFLRGIVPLIGFKYSCVAYDRAERFAGESKYPLRKMLGLALEAVTSFSVVPLRIISILGLIVSAVAIGFTVWVLWIRLFTTNAVPGWASTVLPVYFIGGIQIFCIGVIGEYLGKIYAETKGRPRYVIEKIVGVDKQRLGFVGRGVE